MDTLNLIAAAMGLVLGPLSIWLSLAFYHKAKDAETETAKALASIKAQTGALERLTARWMDRLTRAVTAPRPADESLTLLVTTLAQLPSSLLSQFQGQAAQGGDVQALTDELVSTYIIIYYYVGIANVLGQGLLPEKSEFDPQDDVHSGLQRWVDMSARDFQYMAGILNQVEQKALKASAYKHLLDEAVADWRPHVRSFDEHYREFGEE